MDFYASTFDAVDLNRRPGPDGKVAHRLMTIGPAMIMIQAERPILPSRAPIPDGSSPVVIFVYVEDVDRTVERAVGQAAQVLMPAKDQFWGDRTAWIMDPFGHVWTIATGRGRHLHGPGRSGSETGAAMLYMVIEPRAEGCQPLRRRFSPGIVG